MYFKNKADNQTGTNSKSKYVTELQEYQGTGERHPQPVAQMGRNPPAETPVMLVKAVSFISDQLRMVSKMC